MLELKKISKEAIPNALEKANRYRLLNEGAQAESICLDILAADPANQDAIVTLILSMTDQYGRVDAPTAKETYAWVEKIKDKYMQFYYAGVISERQGRSMLHKSTPGSIYSAYDLIMEAMHYYEQADELHPSTNESAVLRWNACARAIKKNKLKPRPKDEFAPQFGE